jgi:hypothetical protein
MNQINAMKLAYRDGLSDLRIHDLIAKTAHVRIKDALRILIALRAVCREYDFSTDSVLEMAFSEARPTPAEARQCEVAYSWMHENDEIAKDLYEIERLS